MSAEEILKLIETVSPDDTAKMDEIDALVWCWLEDVKYTTHESWGKGNKTLAVFFKGGAKAHWGDRYTRSRDALKSIRPKDVVMREVGHWDSTGQFYVLLYKRGTKQHFYTEACTTEELAELSAIIKAIDFERKAS